LFSSIENQPFISISEYLVVVTYNNNKFDDKDNNNSVWRCSFFAGVLMQDGSLTLKIRASSMSF
jgi:hypothetical protein